MIGNDIIDLQASRVESNWQRKGWLEKVFTTDEIALVSSGRFTDAATMVWLLWSMKEAAYKIWNRTTRLSRYSPKSFACSLFDDASCNGEVSFSDNLYFTNSFIGDDFIHTIATSTNNLTSPSVYLSTINSTDVLPPNITFFKDEYGMPFVMDKYTGAKNIASNSHHGRFQALVYC